MGEQRRGRGGMGVVGGRGERVGKDRLNNRGKRERELKLESNGPMRRKEEI